VRPGDRVRHMVPMGGGGREAVDHLEPCREAPFDLSKETFIEELHETKAPQ